MYVNHIKYTSMREHDPILNPEKLLVALGIGKQDVIADFGCGPGIFSVPAAQMTEGTVYCFDVLSSALDAVTSKARLYNISNITVKRANLERQGGSGLHDTSVNYVIMRKILLQNKQRDMLFAEAYRILRHGGTLLVVGWTENATIGPDASQRLPLDMIESLAKEAGFRQGKTMPTDDAHYAVAFVKE